MKIGVIGHTGTVGRAIFEYYRDHPRGLSIDTVGWSLDDPAWDFAGADYVFICVPTPAENPDGIVREAVARVQGDPVIIIKSTVPPGTTDRIQWDFSTKRIAFSPEFLTARTAALDWRKPPRQIVGYTGRTHAVASEIFAILPNPTETPGNHYLVPAVEAEILKYVHNVHGAIQIILANHWHDVCNAVGADFERVKETAPTSVLTRETIETYWNVWMDGKRGYQGACFPKDTETILRWAEEFGVPVELIAAAQAANLRILGAQGLSDGVDRADRPLQGAIAVSIPPRFGTCDCTVCGCKS